MRLSAPMAIGLGMWLAIVGGCGPGQNADWPDAQLLITHRLEIRVLHAASGRSYRYDIDGSELTVVTHDTTTMANSPVVAHHAWLTREQQKALAQCIAAVPLSKLKSTYDGGGLDGISIEFRIPESTDRLRVIGLRNYFQPDLMRLAACVDAMVPAELRMRYRTGEEAPPDDFPSSTQTGPDAGGQR